MARFDVHRSRADRGTLLVKVQADFLDTLTTTVAVPLRPREAVRREETERLTPSIVIDDDEYTLMTPEIVSLPNGLFGERLTNVETTHRDVITRALDVLFQGF